MALSELPDPEGLLPLVPSDDVDFRAFLEHCLSDRQDGCSLGGGLQVKEGHQPQSQQQPHHLPHHLQQPVRQLSCSLDAQACSQTAGQPAAPAAAACKINHLAYCSQWGMGEAVHRSVSLPGGIPATAAWYCSHPQQLLPQFSLPAAGKLACNTQQGLMASSSNGMHAPPAHRGAAAADLCAGVPPVPVAVPLTAPFSIAAPAATVSLRAPAAMPAACPSGLAPAASSLFAPRALAAAAAPPAPPATAVSLGGGLQAAPLAMRVGSAPDMRAVQATRTIARALSASTLGPNKQPFKKSRKPNKIDDLESKVRLGRYRYYLYVVWICKEVLTAMCSAPWEVEQLCHCTVHGHAGQ